MSDLVYFLVPENNILVTIVIVTEPSCLYHSGPYLQITNYVLTLCLIVVHELNLACTQSLCLVGNDKKGHVRRATNSVGCTPGCTEINQFHVLPCYIHRFVPDFAHLRYKIAHHHSFPLAIIHNAQMPPLSKFRPFLILL